MAKVVLSDITSLANQLSAKQALNDNSQALRDAFDNTLSRDGTGPNTMDADLDLNSHSLLNVADPVSDTDAVNLRSVQGLVDAYAGIIAENLIEGTARVEVFTATAGQLDFPLLDAPGSVDNMHVFDNGIALVPGVDFTLTGATLKTLTFFVARTLDHTIVARYVQLSPTDGLLRADLLHGTAERGADIVQYTATETVKDRLDALGNLRVELAAAIGSIVNSAVVHITNTGTGAVTESVQSRLRSLTVRPEQYGALGDGVTDDSTAFVLCQTAAAGRDIVLKSGKTYRVNSALVFTTDTSIRTDGAAKAVIYHAGQSFTPLTIQGNSPGAQFLAASVTIGTRRWDVVNASSVYPGMLMEVKSSLSWYHDPRPLATDARKSELHRVAAVVGNAIYTEDASNDGYDITSETVTIGFYNPVKATLSNIEVRLVLPAIGVGAANKTGIALFHCNAPLLLNVDTTASASGGIGLTGCYRPIVDGGHSRSSNNYYTGYGVQTAGTAHAIIRNRTAWECRRGVDVSGGNIISRNTLIENCTVLGGGINSEGTVYGWNDDSSTGAYQGGFGSHGPADHTTYRNNTTANMHTHYDCRGRNEVIENNYLIGRCRFGAVVVGHGENLTVRGNRAYDGRMAMKDGGIYDGGSNINARRLDWFLRFHDTYEGRLVGQILIEDNDVMVQDKFMQCSAGTGSAVPNNVTLRHNKVRFATTTGSTEVYFVHNDTVTTIPEGWVIDGNDLARSSGTGRVNLLYNIDPRTSSSSFSTSRTYNIYLADDNATTIQVPSTTLTNAVRVIVDCGILCNGSVYVLEGSAATSAQGTPVKVTCAIGALTGTTGTDVNLNLSLVGGTLYVENRLGSARRIVLTLLHSI